MSVNPLFVNKKRENSILYKKEQAHGHSSVRTPQAFQGSSYDRSSCPPPKRHRSSSILDHKDTEDPFSDNEDFTADDLEEIDILASQAYTPEPDSTNSHKNDRQGKILASNNSAFTSNATKLPSLANRQENLFLDSNKEKIDLGLDVLQIQHKELKQKLNELQEEILVKNGEIKVLRDALRLAESNLEQQKISHVLLEKEKSQIHSEKERDLSKKMQSLQSELEFKDAEMNELRVKLLSCDRSKIAVTSVSPKKSPSSCTKSETCPSPNRARSSFPTKESFNAEMTIRQPTFMSPHTTLTPVKTTENEASSSLVKTFSSSFYAQRKSSQGSVLLNALMQQPIHPGSLGLCHLLSSSPEFTPGSPVRSAHTVSTTGISGAGVVSAPQRNVLRDAQKLALTALNSIAMGEDLLWKNENQNPSGLLCRNKMDQIAGAVHMLPLVEYHITAYCNAQQALEKSGAGPSENQSISSSSTVQSLVTVEDILAPLVEPVLASLRILYHLVFYSMEVVSTLLTYTTPFSDKEQESRTSRSTESGCDYQTGSVLNLHPLFNKLVQLMCFTATKCQKDAMRHQTLRVLVKLAENAPIELLSSFQSLLTKPALILCLAPESPISVGHMTVRLLAMLTDHQLLFSLLCSSSENCMLLAMYTYVTSRSDKCAPESQWLQLEHEVVRLLTKIPIIGCDPFIKTSNAVCQCNREVVKAVILMLHQEWLGLHRSSLDTLTAAESKVVQFLRDAVLLLHCLSQKDKNFSEHCLEVLHQYDQALSGIRAVFRKAQVLKESEEFALDELCPPEVETEENMDCT
ncbi:hypothetical protein GDO86_007380 [Hymenochirus boettgeri]|uniref:ATR-interacting protein n=1 Tax=Hymenochirus boettgeri TaxID=247094 RepID=A0A8T2ITH8_9PIPI|nr:hypothetical protein GDO86_007380 [Hymenochirus boettgeri]